MFPFLEAVIPHMKKQFEDAIVILESIRYRFFHSLCITKSATHTMTDLLAISLAPDIRVNCISPGAVATRWWAGNEERMHGLAGNLPLERISTSEDIADAIPVDTIVHNGTSLRD